MILTNAVKHLDDRDDDNTKLHIECQWEEQSTDHVMFIQNTLRSLLFAIKLLTFLYLFLFIFVIICLFLWQLRG